ncbi:hypothetical protein TetV_119 [Tetraselmis virus 1]|uniref:Uncharacterized protein n=1 Tax=Tetraselmis virus 1 TaxID=2060617 RepID=A0A2P0VMU4_9VIRU|nr:hypothetical protein QJ968_gp119 [Tetraselmis virus 1]AUF82211.1 hypothetical protein TetV_119 [Tetraselmis virus 1]
MDFQGIIRPFVILVLGWFLATRQLILKNSDSNNPAVLMLHPAYHFFYSIFVGAGLLFIFQEKDRRMPSDPVTKCEDYFNETFSKFGFMTQKIDRNSDGVMDILRSSNFIIRFIIIYLVCTIVAVMYAVWLKRFSGQEINKKTLKIHMFRFSSISLGISIALYIVMTLLYKRSYGEEMIPDATSAGCQVLNI